jgi:hypothetical protein
MRFLSLCVIEETNDLVLWCPLSAGFYCISGVSKNKGSFILNFDKIIAQHSGLLRRVVF